MDKLKIFWTKNAINQRNYVLEYWAKRNKSNSFSKKLYIKINDRTSILSLQPEVGKIVNFPNTRTISMGHYSIFYKFQENKIIITAFWDNRQDPNKLLQFLKP
jgi:plasmid stabilization system protein ParE